MSKHLGVLIMSLPAICLVALITYQVTTKYTFMISDEGATMREQLLSNEQSFLSLERDRVNEEWDAVATPLIAQYKLWITLTFGVTPFVIALFCKTGPSKLWPKNDLTIQGNVANHSKRFLYFWAGASACGVVIILLGPGYARYCYWSSLASCLWKETLLVSLCIWASGYGLWASLEFARIHRLGEKNG
ncbi:MAG: hypothetical protein JJ939_14765 [Alphaproteobacteria bacterium]|nr:hypothetical protein [Alphaproteobacteria bacterium]MBO6629675.1 hypothetical protein [Alphaproteobacteria bacterium]MDF1625853.1 hypothetical protein [Parvibaculaceae bacterium]